MVARHKAFTLVELLVVITIIGILVSLLLPAVQNAREAARRMQCTNNLKQIGLAMHNYHNILGAFPPGYISGYVYPYPNGMPNVDTGPGWGWGAFLLPYLEQSALHDQIYMTRDIKDPSNIGARMTSLPGFLCPSDPGRTDGMFHGPVFTVDLLNDSTPTYTTPLTDVNGNPVQVAHGNYVGLYGNPECTPDPGFMNPNNDPDYGPAHQGMLYRNSGVKISDITDGTSNTLFVGERSSNLAYPTWTGAVTGGQVPPHVPDYFNWGPEGAPLLVLAHTGDHNDNPIHTPNSYVAHVDDFWSYHPGGANFLMVDGSVRQIDDTVDMFVWMALGTKAGGETDPLGSFSE
jgi:prepilin-type N-terminal cleavage/methylation domain-containing protein/prepilin-type processing-associated H-X9-DG protein